MNSMEAILGMISRCVGLRRSCDGRVAAVPLAMPRLCFGLRKSQTKTPADLAAVAVQIGWSTQAELGRRLAAQTITALIEATSLGGPKWG